MRTAKTTHIDAWAIRPVCPDLRRRRAHSERAVILFLMFLPFLGLTAGYYLSGVPVAALSVAALPVPSVAQVAARTTTVPTAAPRIAPFFPAGVLQWTDLIVSESDAQHVDPNLTAAAMTLESCGWKNAVSHSGAIGLMQLMAYNLPPGANPWDPQTNIKAGVSYLAYCKAIAGGDVGKTAACYNGGPGALKNGYTAQTVAYVNAIGLIMTDVSHNAPNSRGMWLPPVSGMCAKAGQP